MRAPSFFREARLPSRHEDQRLHERFLVDTYVERRAAEQESAVGAFARRLRRLVGGDLR